MSLGLGAAGVSRGTWRRPPVPSRAQAKAVGPGRWGGLALGSAFRMLAGLLSAGQGCVRRGLAEVSPRHVLIFTNKAGTGGIR